MGLFLSCFSARAYGLRLNTLRRSEPGSSNKQTNSDCPPRRTFPGHFRRFTRDCIVATGAGL